MSELSETVPASQRSLLDRRDVLRGGVAVAAFLGHADRKYWPQNRGFEHFYGNLVGEVDYFTKERGGIVDWQRNGKFLQEDGYYTTLIGNEAVRFIEEHDTSRPLFLYFASLTPHAHYQVPQDYLDRYPLIEDKNRQTYAAIISALDDQVGRIVAALEKRNMRDNTIIIFSSDNGGARSALTATGARSEKERKESGGLGLGDEPPASNGKLRGGKGSLHEGGVRVPTIVNWPAKLGPRTIDEPLYMVKIMPTFLALGGGTDSPDHPIDGRDMWPTLAAGNPSPNNDILISVEAVQGAIRNGNWKLFQVATLPCKTELFVLSLDPSEANSLATAHPETVGEL